MAVCVLDPTGDLDRVGEAEEVLVEVIVRVPLDDPLDVFVAVRVVVPVLEFTIVFVCKGDLDIDVEPVDVRDPRADHVSDGEAEDVLDVPVVLDCVGLDEPVLDCVGVEV